MRLGSLFDGSGTAPLAASMCGIDPVWASEIEPYPIAVTKARFPHMLHLGSITEIDGGKVVPVDIICGGSPCQDLSVAGKQAGLHEGTRSHLFFEMTRIITEMRGATNGKYPRYIVWENVPGAFSSNSGRDFLAVLRAFAEIADPDVYVPEPESRGGRLAWKYAGEMVGDGWSIAWRTVDAQYWGVPQRRRRIYLVADLGSERAGEVLFERTGVSGDYEPGRAQREEAAGDVEGSVAGGYLFDITGVNSNSMKSPTPDSCFKQRNIARTLDSFVGQPECNQGGNVVVCPAIARTLTAEHDSSPCVDRGQNVVAVDTRNFALGREVSGTLQAKATGGYSLNYNNPILYEPASMLAENWRETENKNALRSSESKSAHAVVYSSHSHGTLTEGVGTVGTGTRAVAEMVAVYPQRTGALCANSHPGSYTGQDAYNDMLPVLPGNCAQRKYIVRRLTPLECCRLQGFPDWWEDGVQGSDSARYRMWGNGMALPNMLHVMRGIVREVGA